MNLKLTLALAIVLAAVAVQAQYNAVYNTNGTLLKPSNPKIPGSLTVTSTVTAGRFVGPISGTNKLAS